MEKGNGGKEERNNKWKVKEQGGKKCKIKKDEMEGLKRGDGGRERDRVERRKGRIRGRRRRRRVEGRQTRREVGKEETEAGGRETDKEGSREERIKGRRTDVRRDKEGRS